MKAFSPANKHPLGEWVLTRLLIRPAFRRAFSGVYMYVDPAALEIFRRTDLPLIVSLTHTSWWDGYMTAIINASAVKRDGYLMMEQKHLAGVPFFTWAGIFGVDRDDPRKALESVQYATNLLTERPGRALWMFPQGTITHPDKRPLGVFGGVSNIARRVGRCAVVPVALRYEFRLQQAPEAYIRTGPPLLLDPEAERLSSREITAYMEEAMAGADDALHAELVAGRLEHYRCIVRGRRSINQVWDSAVGLVGRLKRRLPGG